ncbi:hypothetical protein phiK7A1_024c [Pseudomonas phage phiK7A1]|uniref:Uncharacterized protein n=1 Tax=Pseudomonas phage phiK7A1 TaxID=2759194 RepID=A0A7H0XFM4_9CAUD|nr:hypothetical protein phiK7A1_024c [Pseudomonas phage phiK7A1]
MKLFTRTYEIHSHMVNTDELRDDARNFPVVTVGWKLYTVRSWADPVNLVNMYQKEQEEKYPDLTFMLQSLRRV